MSDQLVSGLSADGYVSAKAVVSTQCVAQVAEMQGLRALAAAALGRSIICTQLLAEGLEGDETFQVNFQGDGPLRGVLATSNGRLESRGYVGNPNVVLPANSKGKIDVGGGVGKGSLTVVRTKRLPGEVNPSFYSSITNIISGEIAEDLNNYLVESEQKQGALAAGVLVVSPDGHDTVVAAGGWHVQLLPGADDAAIAKLEANIQQMTLSPSAMIKQGSTPTDIVSMLLQGMDAELFPAQSPCFKCECSDERVWRTLRLLPKEEVQGIVDTGETVEVKCEFCSSRYELSATQISEKLLSK